MPEASRRQILHVDVNSAYASFERVLDPSLDGRALLVLSNNDGAAVALSAEAKALGLKLGDPWFKIAPSAERLGIVAKSSNYALYGDLSSRFMQLLARYCNPTEVYSCDEAFAQPKGTPEELYRLAAEIRSAMFRVLHLPVCVGVAPTKVLAKMANKWAKKVPAFEGVCVWDLVPEAEREALIHRLPTSEIWGVAGRLSRRLAGHGITTAAQLRDAPADEIRARYGVVLMRIVLELRGIPCLPIEQERVGREQLIFSRSFSRPITTPEDMATVMSVYAQNASARLARHHLQARMLQAFAGTSFYSNGVQDHPHALVRLPMPTADPVLLTKAAKSLVPQVIPGVRYVRACVMLTDLAPAGAQSPLEIFENVHEERGIGTLIENVNRRHGRGTIGLGSAGLRGGPDWTMRQEMRSPRYTTHWDELAVVKAS